MLIVTGILYGIAWRKKEATLDNKDYQSVVSQGETRANAYGQQIAKQQAQQVPPHNSYDSSACTHVVEWLHFNPRWTESYGLCVCYVGSLQYAQAEINRTKDSLMSGGSGGGGGSMGGSMGSGMGDDNGTGGEISGGLMPSGHDPNFDPYANEHAYAGDVAYGGTTEI